MGNIVIRPLAPREVAEQIEVPPGVSPFTYGGFDNGELHSVFGLAWESGICTLWFRMECPKPGYVFHVRHWAKRLLRTATQLGEESVFVERDADFPTSERLLRLLGFEPFGNKDGKEIWVWHNSLQ